MAWDTASIGAKGKNLGIFRKGRFANIAQKKSLTNLKIGQAFESKKLKINFSVVRWFLLVLAWY